MDTMDAAQIDALAREHRERLVRAITLVCGDRNDAEEAVQHALAVLWQKSQAGDDIVAPIAWLATVATNYLRSSWRRSARARSYLNRLRVDEAATADATDVLAVRGALAALPRRQREAAVLYYVLDLSVEDAAAAMRATPGMVKNALFRARQALARALDDSGATQ